MNKLGNFDTKRIFKDLHVKKNLKKLIVSVENDDAKSMEKIGIDFFRKVVREEVDIFKGMLSAIYWIIENP